MKIIILSLSPQSPITYKVKILNPNKRKKPLTRLLHNFTGKFRTIEEIKEKLHSEFEDVLPESSSLDVGYFDGRQSVKMSLISTKDIDAMYKARGTSNSMFLWAENGELDCDTPDAPPEKKRKKRSEKEEEIDEIYEELSSEHSDSYTVPQLRLWARMIKSGTYDDYHEPPKVPLITGKVFDSQHKREKDTMANAFASAANAIAKALTPQQQVVPQPVTSGNESTSRPTCMGISPNKSTELRMKNLQQLRLLHQLYEEGVLTDNERAEQKSFILDAMRQL